MMACKGVALSRRCHPHRFWAHNLGQRTTANPQKVDNPKGWVTVHGHLLPADDPFILTL